MKNKTLDVVIIGGGPAGTSAAIKLKQLGVENVLLLESTNYGTIRMGESLPAEAKIVFEKLGILNNFLQEHHSPCLGNCSAWGSDQLGFNDGFFNISGTGWHLDRNRFDSFMLNEAQKIGARCLLDSQFINAYQEKNYLVIKYKNTNGELKTINTRYAIDASGKRSLLAKTFNIKSHYVDRLVTIAGRFQPINNSQFSQLTLLESQPQGWWYAAKLPDNSIIASVTTDAETLKASDFKNPDTWIKQLNQTKHLSQQLKHFEFDLKSLQAYATPSFKLAKISGNNWLAVGDAAMTFDTITSQGIMKGLLSGSLAAKAIAKNINDETSDFSHYESTLNVAFDNFIELRKNLYRSEQRWLSSPFWLNRERIHTQLSNQLAS